MPTLLEITDHETVRQIRLARPPANALSPELMIELDAALDAAVTRGGAVVISGGANIFSAGLDVPALLELDRPALEAAWATFLSVVRKSRPRPCPSPSRSQAMRPRADVCFHSTATRAS